MSKTIEYYLNVLYPDIDSASEAEKKKYKKDKEFLTKNLDRVNKEYDDLSYNIEQFGEKRFVELLLQFTKEWWDPETKIIKYADTMHKILDKNSFISQNFDYYLEAMKEERALEEKYKDAEEPTTPIDFNTVYALSIEFLKQIDPSGEMANGLRNLMVQGRIQVHAPEDKITSSFDRRRGIINYSFNGTIENACTLVHEYLHYWVDKKANPTEDREKHSMLNEVETIFYEKAFALFLEKKGLLPDGAESVQAVRHKKEHEKDPNNGVIMFIELAKKIHEKGEIDQDDIVDMLSQYIPGVSDRAELWEKGSRILLSFIDRYPLTYEIVSGACMYRFDEMLALRMGFSHDSIREMHKLSHLVIDQENDHRFMEEYEKLRARMNSRSTKLGDISDLNSSQENR